jgi:hypothetical protein
MKRADELAALDESNRALLRRSMPPRMLAAAKEALNAVHMTAAEIAKTQHELEIP